MWSSAWGAAISHRVPNVVGKANVKPLKCCALPRSPWHSGPLGTLHCPKAEAGSRSHVWGSFQRTYFSEALQILYVDSLTDVVAPRPWARNLWNTRPSVSLKVISIFLICEWKCSHSYSGITSHILNQLTTVSLNACCSILYISMVILPNFQQNLMQKHFTSAH